MGVTSYSKLTTANGKNLPTHSTSDARASASERSACLTATFRNGSTRRFPWRDPISQFPDAADPIGPP